MLRDLSSTLADNPAQSYTGMAVLDLDGDGELECVVAAYGGRNLVLKWGGDAFYDVAVAPLTATRAPSMGLAAGDADGDGREELYMATGEAGDDQLLAWRRGTWIDLLAGLQQRNVSSQSVLAYDRFGMGRYGFLVAQEGGPFRYLEVLGQDRVEELGAVLGLARIAGGRSLVSGPLTSESLAIYAANEGIAHMLFTATSNARFEERAARHQLAGIKRAARGIGLIDANHDGQLDLITAYEDGPVELLVRGQQGLFQPIPLTQRTRARSLVVADFDNDGFEEILINCQGEANLLFAWRDGDWRATDAGESWGYGTGLAIGDWNHDGFLEVITGHGEAVAQPLCVYGVEPNGNHWLRVQPLTAAGAPARGAIVRMTPSIRVIDSGSGYLCQNEPIAHFGLGQQTQHPPVTITWPDGTTVELPSGPANRTIRVPYPTA